MFITTHCFFFFPLSFLLVVLTHTFVFRSRLYCLWVSLGIPTPEVNSAVFPPLLLFLLPCWAHYHGTAALAQVVTTPGMFPSCSFLSRCFASVYGFRRRRERQSCAAWLASGVPAVTCTCPLSTFSCGQCCASYFNREWYVEKYSFESGQSGISHFEPGELSIFESEGALMGGIVSPFAVENFTV